MALPAAVALSVLLIPIAPARTVVARELKDEVERLGHEAQVRCLAPDEEKEEDEGGDKEEEEKDHGDFQKEDKKKDDSKYSGYIYYDNLFISFIVVSVFIVSNSHAVSSAY